MPINDRRGGPLFHPCEALHGSRSPMRAKTRLGKREARERPTETTPVSASTPAPQAQGVRGTCDPEAAWTAVSWCQDVAWPPAQSGSPGRSGSRPRSSPSERIDRDAASNPAIARQSGAEGPRCNYLSRTSRRRRGSQAGVGMSLFRGKEPLRSGQHAKTSDFRRWGQALPSALVGDGELHVRRAADPAYDRSVRLVDL